MSLFMLLSVILQFSCLSCYLVSYICSCSCYYFMHIVYMQSFSLYTHTHQVAFWRPWICMSRYWTLVLLCRCSMRWYTLRGTGRSLFWFWYSCISLFLLLFLIHVYHTWLLFHSLFHFRSCVAFICIIAVIIDYYGLDLNLVQVNWGLACIRGVFSSRIYVADSRHFFFSRILGSGAWQGFLGIRARILTCDVDF